MLVSPRLLPRQHTEITITSHPDAMVPYTSYGLKSNRLKEKDTYLIIKDGDTLSRGVVIDGEWY